MLLSCDVIVDLNRFRAVLLSSLSVSISLLRSASFITVSFVSTDAVDNSFVNDK